jgi:CRP/FNR family transcriptional regulator, anaerobic regulatory protein
MECEKASAGEAGAWAPACASIEAVSASAPLEGGATLCMACPVRESCIGRVAAQVGTRHLATLLVGRRRLQAGEVMYLSGQAFVSLYAVRSGSLKSTGPEQDGERVRGFHFAGEMVGADGLAQGRHTATVTAMEDTEVCALRFCASGGRAYLGRLWDMMSRDLLSQRARAIRLASMPPQQRVTALLATLARRVRRPGAPAREHRLRLSPSDVAGYLRVPVAVVEGVLAGRDGSPGSPPARA